MVSGFHATTSATEMELDWISVEVLYLDEGDPVDGERGEGTVMIELDLGADARRVVDEVKSVRQVEVGPVTPSGPPVCWRARGSDHF